MTLRRHAPNAKIPTESISKVEGSGVVAFKVVSGKLEIFPLTTMAKPGKANDPGDNVGVEVVPVYNWVSKLTVPNPSVQVATVVPVKQISNPPPLGPLKNRTKVGVIATAEPFSE